MRDDKKTYRTAVAWLGMGIILISLPAIFVVEAITNKDTYLRLIPVMITNWIFLLVLALGSFVSFCMAVKNFIYRRYKGQ